MAIVQVTALARNGGMPRGERVDVVVPKPFTPRQLVDAVRTAIVRRAALPGPSSSAISRGLV
jgi:DNA-binding response OmpR family regulator